MSIRTTRRKKFDIDRIAKSCALDRSAIENSLISVEELKIYSMILLVVILHLRKPKRISLLY